MSTVEEGTHITPDGQELYTKTWKPNGRSRAILAFVHGFSDHSNAYYDFFPTLAASGIEVRAFDQRGWGRTVKQPQDRGNTGPTTVVLSDIHSFLESLVPLMLGTNTQSQNPTPLFLMGNSMGGAEVLTYALHSSSPYHNQAPNSNPATKNGKKVTLAGVLAYSPLIALDPASRPYALTVTLGRLAGKLLPWWQRYSPLDASLMSRDERVGEDWVADQLCHDTGTLEGLANMLDRGLWLEGIAEGIHGHGNAIEGLSDSLPPLWFGHGSADRVASWDATRKLAEELRAKAAGDVTFCSFEGAYHKLHAELPDTTREFERKVTDWVLAKSVDEGK